MTSLSRNKKIGLISLTALGLTLVGFFFTGNLSFSSLTSNAINSYSVTFSSENATKSTPIIKTVAPPATTVGTLPRNPINNGYTFGGWYTATNGGGTVFTKTTPVTANITVYAQWVPNVSI